MTAHRTATARSSAKQLLQQITHTTTSTTQGLFYRWIINNTQTQRAIYVMYILAFTSLHLHSAGCTKHNKIPNLQNDN